MYRSGLLAVLFAGCGGEGDSGLLATLAGNWSGTITTEQAAVYTATAAFDWDEEKQILSGEVNVDEPELAHVYAVRRSSVVDNGVSLELTDATDGTRGLRINGTVSETFDGDATLRYPCELGTCGYVGVLALVKGPPSASTGDTGAVR